jgi:hypothetical protein
MKTIGRSLCWLVPVVFAIGCGAGTPQKNQTAGAQAQTGTAAEPVDETKVQAALAKLDPADRKLAEAQRFCAVDTEERLGAMGPPVKVMVQGEPVFLCCKGCSKGALANPEKTLARVKELKEKTTKAATK